MSPGGCDWKGRDLLISEFRKTIEDTAEPQGPIVLVDGDEPGYAFRGRYASGEVVERKRPFKKLIVVSLEPADQGLLMEREPFLAFLRSLERRFSAKHHIVLRLYEHNPELNYFRGERLMTRHEYAAHTIDGYRDVLSDMLWGQVRYKGDNEYHLTNGGNPSRRESEWHTNSDSGGL